MLQLVRVGVENIGNKFLRNFPELESLNLQGNHLQRLGDISVPKLKRLFLAGEYKWIFNENAVKILLFVIFKISLGVV